MPDRSPLLSCPVCLGVTMEKVTIGPRGDLHVDHCRRCSGVWLEHGEVQALRAQSQSSLWESVPRRPDAFRMRCHDCHAIMERAEEACPSCGWNNHLNCPVCDQPMLTEAHAGLRLDVCRHCRGVWFDHHELAEIWKGSVDRSMLTRNPGDGVVTAVGNGVDIANAATEVVVANLPGAFGAAPEVAAAAAEAAGEAAGGVFSVIVEIVSSIF